VIMRLRLITIALAAVLLGGCAHNAHRTAEAQAHYQAQQTLAALRPPLFELRAQPGQTIQLSGVESLVVHDPRELSITPLPQQRSQLLGLLETAVRVAAPIYGVKIAADSLVDLADSIGRNSGDHSVTTISDSNNTRGDTIGDVAGPGAGLGNSTSVGAGAAVGDDNWVDNATGDRVGGDQIGGDRIDTDIGGDQIGGDRIDTDIGGDQIGRDRIDNGNRRVNSDGPLDIGDCRDSGDCSMIEPPPPDPDAGG